MSSRFERLRTAGEDVTLSNALEVRRLLGIVDEILGVESYPEDDQLPFLEDQPMADLTCASCGGEIFRTAFCCVGTCLRDGKTEVTARSQIIICPLCFVDGRVCSCNNMQPVRIRAMSTLMETRNIAKKFILDSARRLLLSEEEEETDSNDVLKR